MYDSFENLEQVKFVGKGAFGKVYKFIDKEKNKKIAIKVVNNEERFRNAALKEIRILKILRLANTENYPVIEILGEFVVNTVQYIVFEYMSTDLYRFYRKYPDEVDIDLAIYISYKVAEGLNFIHSLDIIHSDLKPENIMLRYDEEKKYIVKIIDFGSTLDNKCKMRSNFYIQSRYYRAPEILYKISYGIHMDIWSYGCILFEIIYKIPLFAGRNEKEMIYFMCEMLDIPYEYDMYLNSDTFIKYFSYDIINTTYNIIKDDKLLRYRKPNKDGLDEMLNYKFEKYFDMDYKSKYIILLLIKIITYDYKNRIKASDILNDKLFIEIKLNGYV